MLSFWKMLWHDCSRTAEQYEYYKSLYRILFPLCLMSHSIQNARKAKSNVFSNAQMLNWIYTPAEQRINLLMATCCRLHCAFDDCKYVRAWHQLCVTFSNEENFSRDRQFVSALSLICQSYAIITEIICNKLNFITLIFR